MRMRTIGSVVAAAALVVMTTAIPAAGQTRYDRIVVFGTSLSDPVQLFVPPTHTPRIQTGFFSRPQMLTGRNMSWVTVILRLAPVYGSHAGLDCVSTWTYGHPDIKRLASEP